MACAVVNVYRLSAHLTLRPFGGIEMSILLLLFVVSLYGNIGPGVKNKEKD